MSGRAKSICAICFTISMALAGSRLPYAAASGDSSVLEGTWHFATYSDNSISNDPGVEGARLTIDPTGNVSGGIWSDSWGDSGGFSGGSVTIDTEGKVEGSVTYSGDRTDTFNFSHFRLSPDNDVVLGLGRTSNSFISLTLVAKGGNGFTRSDLAGTWYFFNFWDEAAPETGSAGWTRAVVTVNTSGTITSGSGTDSEGDSFSISGSMSITSEGVVGLDVTTTNAIGSESVAVNGLRMVLNKNVIGGVFDQDEDVNTAIMIKAGTSYATADLEGSWYAFSFEDKEGGHEPGWTRSFFTLSSSGSVNAGEDVEDDGSVSTIASGGLNIASDGLVSGTIDGEAFANFRMDASKNFIAGVNSEPDNDRLFAVIVKATSIPAGASIGGIVPIIQILLDD